MWRQRPLLMLYGDGTQ